MSRNVCSFSPRSLSFDFEGVDDCPSSFLRTRREARRVGGDGLEWGESTGASESDSEGDSDGLNSKASRMEGSGMKRRGRESYMSLTHAADSKRDRTICDLVYVKPCEVR